MSRSFSAAVVVYVLFIIVLDHGYLEKEKPLAGVDLSVIMARPGCGARLLLPSDYYSAGAAERELAASIPQRNC